MRGKRKRWVGFLCLSLVALTGWGAYVLLLMHQTEARAVPKKADVAIVLGAAVWGDEPSPGLRERLDMAAQLFREGYVSHVIVSGGLGSGKRWEEAVIMKRYLEEKGIPSEVIHEENEASDTYENLAFSQAIMQRHGWKRALIVSHGYHLARAMEMAETLGLLADPVAAPTESLFLPYHKAREVLAFTKWRLSRLFR